MREDAFVPGDALECGCGTAVQDADVQAVVRCPTCDVSWHVVDGRWRLWEAESPPMDWLDRGEWGNKAR